MAVLFFRDQLEIEDFMGNSQINGGFSVFYWEIHLIKEMLMGNNLLQGLIVRGCPNSGCWDHC